MKGNRPISYWAGIFDGEGSVCIVHRLDKRARTKATRGGAGEWYSVNVGITNTCLALLTQLQRQWGGSIGEDKLRSVHHRRRWKWQANCRAGIKFLAAVRPYLIVKARDVSLALTLQDHVDRAGPHRTRRLTRADISARAALSARLLSRRHQRTAA